MVVLRYIETSTYKRERQTKKKKHNYSFHTYSIVLKPSSLNIMAFNVASVSSSERRSVTPSQYRDTSVAYQKSLICDTVTLAVVCHYYQFIHILLTFKFTFLRLNYSSYFLFIKCMY